MADQAQLDDLLLRARAVDDSFADTKRRVDAFKANPRRNPPVIAALEPQLALVRVVRDLAEIVVAEAKRG